MQGDNYMSAPTQKGEWTKELGGIWFLCLFAGFMTGGVGLFFTIPIAIVCTIYAFWAEMTGKKSQPTASSHYQSFGGGIENMDTMAIPHSGYSAAMRRAEYIRRGQSPSGVIDGVYNDTYRPSGVSYNDTNRDWDADA
jgi:hypothetical protein